MTVIVAFTKENNMILNLFFFDSGETLLTAGVVVSNYPNVTALNHHSLSLSSLSSLMYLISSIQQ